MSLLQNKNIKLFLSYVVPSMISMLIIGSYSIVDSIFIGQSGGAVGLAAVAVTWPLVMLFGAFGDMFGTGAAILVSRARGKGDIEPAKKLFGAMFVIQIIFGLFLTGCFLFELKDILVLFGATEELLPLSIPYAIILIYGGLPCMLLIGTSAVLRNDGRPVLAMWLMVVGLLMNILLDYVLIFPCGWGIKGAAYATLISQVVMFVVQLGYFATPYTQLRYTWSMFLVKWSHIKEVIFNGIPSLGNQLAIIVMLFLHNYQSLHYGKVDGLAAYTFIGAIESLGSLLLTGLSLGVQPLVSYLYGGKRCRRQNIIGNMGYYTAFVLGLILMMISVLGRNIFPAWFNLHGEVAQMASHGLVISSTAFVLLGVIRVAGYYYQATGKIKISSWLIYGDAFIVLPLCLFVLPLFFGLDGVWLAMPVSRVILFGFVCYLWFGVRNITILK
ncbi:MAG: MATE family efflux transporter [Alphaproteobacteria bacterium]|nr:MATE family efflux transporter [Alphaproteobacteria bacterium]